MKRLKAVQLAALALVFHAGFAAFGQEAATGSINLKLVAEKEVIVVNDKGEKEVKRTSVATVIPGDHVVYTITYTNIGDQPADDVVIDNPVPANTAYIMGTAAGDGTEILYSVDGGSVFDKAENLTIKDEEGNDMPAMAKDYTNVRWIVKAPVAPGATGEVLYRVQIK